MAFIDSAGLSALVGTAKRAAAHGGSLYAVCARPKTRQLFRLTGLDWRNAAILGTLMNTRGLVELIVLNIGLDLQVISPSLFTMMVVMALVTTIATSPVLQLLTPQTASVIPKEP